MRETRNTPVEEQAGEYALEELVGKVKEPLHLGWPWNPRTLCGIPRIGSKVIGKYGGESAPGLCGRCLKLYETRRA